MFRLRTLATLGLGAAACAAGVGLVLAQEAVNPPPPPGYVPGVGPAPLPGEAPRGPSPSVALGGEAPPPEEAAPPPQAVGEATLPAEPLPSPDAGKPVDPMKRPRFVAAILQAVDKTTAETLRFEARINEPVRYRGLTLTVHACEAAAPDEGFEDAMAHLDVQAEPSALVRQASREVYRGWMFASSPGLHAVEHPLYDVWLIACKTAAPAAAGVNL